MSTPAPTATPTPTPTRAAPLKGTIAYPAFNESNQTYDLYFGDVASGESRRYRTDASQPSMQTAPALRSNHGPADRAVC